MDLQLETGALIYEIVRPRRREVGFEIDVRSTTHTRELIRHLTVPRVLFIVILVLVASSSTEAQSRTGQRGTIRASSPLLHYESSPTQLIETFALMREANSGSLAAQHELGYRYLMGRGVSADSVKGAEWILKAANRSMALAEYNAGILYTHALGVPWNPFEAFRWFRRAAGQDQPAALFILGLMYTDGLLVPQDWARAWSLVGEAATKGYEPAREMLVQFRRLNIDTTRAASKPEDRSLGLFYLQFAPVADAKVSDTTLARELAREVPVQATDVTDAIVPSTSTNDELAWLMAQAERGIPEAHIVLARIFEKGIGVKPDLIRAAIHYLRANRLDSPRAPRLLADLIEREDFVRELTERTLAGDLDARYVWAALAAIEFDRRIGTAQAQKLLEENAAVRPPHALSILELGLWYATGRHVTQDPAMAIGLWQQADSAGLSEGRMRTALATLVLRGRDAADLYSFIQSEADSGSVLAQAALGFCFEKGIGVAVSQPEASAMYRKAAMRGSQTAYRALKNMYDALRPASEEFMIE